ncbi:10796_t:CDS:2, partial [Dentiscutata erythropus]
FILFDVFDSEVLADNKIEVLVANKAEAEAKESGDSTLSNVYDERPDTLDFPKGKKNKENNLGKELVNNNKTGENIETPNKEKSIKIDKTSRKHNINQDSVRSENDKSKPKVYIGPKHLGKAKNDQKIKTSIR